jgi:hypothetical protein
VNVPTSMATRTGFARPASMLAKSSRSLTSRCSRRPLRCARVNCSRTPSASGSAGSSSTSPSGPSSSVSGVRSSWLTSEKNVVLARSSSASDSARRRSAANARLLATAAANWPATSS